MSFVYELPPSDTVKLDKIVLRIEGSRNTNEERTRDNEEVGTEELVELKTR